MEVVMHKITNGPNDRPRDETIAQSGPGFPDDSGTPIEASDEEVERVRAKLMEMERPKDGGADNPVPQAGKGGAR
jgi:hypothetical protein